ncbi:hypothetical protein Tco_1022937 [Tanacetum coccineum]
MLGVGMGDRIEGEDGELDEVDGVEEDPLVGEGVETDGDVGKLRCMDRVQVCMGACAWDRDEFMGSCEETGGLGDGVAEEDALDGARMKLRGSIGMRGNKRKEVIGHGVGVISPFQQCVDDAVRPRHFVPGCVEER